MFSSSDMSGTTEFSLRSEGSIAMPAFMASWIEPPESLLPKAVAVPPVGCARPKRHCMSSVVPQPMSPVRPITWPRRTSIEMSEKPGPERWSSVSTHSPVSRGSQAPRSEIVAPTIMPVTSRGVVSAMRPCATNVPLRSTV